MPKGGGFGTTDKLNGEESVLLPESVTVIVMPYKTEAGTGRVAPTTVPLITPVLVFNESPVGRDGETPQV
jgi:hypothetical protein